MIEQKRIILASASPRRKLLLNQIGVKFHVKKSHIKESLKLQFSQIEMAEYWARKKAEFVSRKHPEDLIIGADTIICHKNRIIGKPKNKLDNFKILKELSGRTHEVITGVCFFNSKRKIDVTFNERTYVSLKKLKNKDINFYIENFNTLDKAGGYGIQDFFAVYIKKINGCYYNVMGLPLSAFYSRYKLIQKNY